MPQQNYHLADTNYMGTLSDLDPSKPTAREARGKVKGNKREPRNRAFGQTDTLVTRADGTQYVIPRRATRSASKRTTQKTIREARIIETVRATVSYDQRHREQY
jgi:hypothetical protein